MDARNDTGYDLTTYKMHVFVCSQLHTNISRLVMENVADISRNIAHMQTHIEHILASYPSLDNIQL